MIISNMDVTGNFRYLWLKRITGIDLNQHCAKSLLGQYNNSINTRQKHFESIQLKDGIYYLCGVTVPYVWENNFHLAFTHCAGSAIDVNEHGIAIHIEDAQRIFFDETCCNTLHPKYRLKPFRTCRNWQFANYLQKSGIFQCQ